MKRLSPVLAGFGIPALLALYIGTAPLGGIFAGLDVLADLTIDMVGRAAAVILLLVIALVLGYFIGRHTFKRDRSDDPAYDGAATPPAWTPSDTQSAPTEATQPTFTLTALPSSTETGGTVPAQPAIPAPVPYGTVPLEAPLASHASSSETDLPAPVILIRKPREQEQDWFTDSSWLGGLPRLGDTPWPHDAQGIALPFAAQIDLSALASAYPESPLPREGSLAFFLGSGAVVAAADNTHDFSAPPENLQPAFNEGGAPFPTSVNRMTRWFFPFWPVDLTLLKLPKNLRNYKNAAQESAIEEAMAVRLKSHAPLRDHPYYASGVGAPVENLWWHSVIHLTDQLHEALEASGNALEKQRALIAEKYEVLQKLEAAASDEDALEQAQEEAEYLLADYHTMEEQSAALPEMIAALEHFITDREPWTVLTPEEQHIMGDILADVHERFGELVRNFAPSTLGQLATISLRTMMSGPPEMFAAMPEAALNRINSDYRLPPVYQHQMFGLPAAYQTARGREADDILLLQLGYDDLMEWQWDETGLFQFWISPSNAAAGNWQAAKLTFQSE